MNLNTPTFSDISVKIEVIAGSKAPCPSPPSAIFINLHTFVSNKRGERGMKMSIVINGGGGFFIKSKI